VSEVARCQSVRVDANPTQLASYGLTLANLQSVLSLQNADLAKGQISDGIVTADIIANDQISHAADYKPLVVGYRHGAAVRLVRCRPGDRLRGKTSALPDI
jgi:multidrug efflux pump